MDEAEFTEMPDAEVTDEREDWTIERAWEEIRNKNSQLNKNKKLKKKTNCMMLK